MKQAALREAHGERAPPWHALNASEVLAQLSTTANGLSDAEVEARLARTGPNVVPPVKARSAWRIFVAQLESVVVLLLVAAAAIALVMRDVPDAIAIGAVLLINVTLGFTTELRARRAVDALLRLEVRRASVHRGGQLRVIDATLLVPGDVIDLEAGQSVAADARLLVTTELQVNESALTGESVPSEKRADPPLDVVTVLPDRTDMVYRSTIVVAGHARAVVVATGRSTELGRIGELVQDVGESRTPIERRLDELGGRLAWVAIGAAALISALGLLQGAAIGEMLETGIALAVAAVPEGLPAIATIAMAVGVRRMARRRAIVRRLSAVEALGAVTVVCTDKTGTLTTGEMTVVRLWAGEREYSLVDEGRQSAPAFRDETGAPLGAPLAPPQALAIRVAALANRATLVGDVEGGNAHGDPTEVALLVCARALGVEQASARAEWPEVGELPFSSERGFMATFHRSPEGALWALVKGAPRRVLALTDRMVMAGGESPIGDPERDAIEARNDRWARDGIRVLALAAGVVFEPTEKALADLTFVGLVGLTDPPAAGVRETIHRLREAGIRTVMITGDQQLTAAAIGRQLGVIQPGDVTIDGRELQAMSDEALVERASSVVAFSRVSPADKLRIVTAYQQAGGVVAMLGDGINDAPALRKADVGVAMGGRGADVAKEAAAVVLQDDRFETITAAVEEGRVISGNIRKAIFYLFSCNLAELMVLLVARLATLPIPLLPLQILWLNLVTDTFPALALALEPRGPNVMRRPPMAPNAPILSRGMLASIALSAALITASTLAAFGWGLATSGREQAVTLSFVTLALAQILHLGNARSSGPVTSAAAALRNRYAVGAVLLAFLLQALAVHAGPLAAALGTRPLGATDWLVALGASAIPAVIGQTIKWRRRGSSHAAAAANEM